jgi:ribosome biogenesis GTPase / thiamine phosphate phosphatase
MQICQLSAPDEPHGAVKAAVEAEEIHSIRYQSYLSILEEVMDQNHWERQNI